MRPHLHSSAGLFAGSIALLLGGIGVVRAEAGDRPATVATAGSAREWPTPTTAAPTTTTTEAPTTTTTAPPPPPPPTVTTPPRPAPPTTVAPPPAPVAVTATSAPTDLGTYANQLLREVVPARWLAAVPARVDVISGNSSWSSWGGLIEIGDWHLTRPVAKAKNVLAHEWGHQLAWHYGTDVYNGAPPAGFPWSGSNAEELWADCVGAVLSGVQYPTGGLPDCTGAPYSFAQGFLAAGPGPRLR